MNAFIFPGQGAQVVGMGKDFYDNFDTARQLFQQADDALGYSISNICFNGSEDDLKLTANTQPAILVVSVIVAELLKARGITPDIAGGHSLGEYSALVVAGSLNFQDAVKLVHKRGQFMQEAVPVGEGAMAAIIGLDDSIIIDTCADVGDVQAVNFNCPGQTVIAGKTAAVNAAVDKLKSVGAKKAVILPVSAPFHSKLMAPAAIKLAKELDNVNINDAAFPVASNFTGELETSANDIKRNLIAQADNPVKWIQCVNAMFDFGADTFIECGVGKTLCGFNRRINKKIRSLNVEDLGSFQNVLSTFTAG
jgi:[acyl-carrier-protein] S-malonyltransferase